MSRSKPIRVPRYELCLKRVGTISLPLLRVSMPIDAAEVIHHAIGMSPVEVALLVGCNGQGHVVGLSRIASTASTSVLHLDACGLVRAALNFPTAVSFIWAHNHPSGDPYPSSADFTVFRKVRELFELVNLTLQDQVIVCPDPERFWSETWHGTKGHTTENPKT